MAYDLVFESLLISAGLYRYHQREAFLLFGVPWSNMIYNANLSVVSYLALRKARSGTCGRSPGPRGRDHFECEPGDSSRTC
jgi:hypothetical protein